METVRALENLVLREMACVEEDVFEMKSTELISALNRMKVQTGSLACLDCGYEHCSTQGCCLIREAVDKLCAMEWIDAKVELPPKREDVLVRYGNGYIGIDWSDSTRCFMFDRLYGRVTHWMPLPEMPEEEIQDG